MSYIAGYSNRTATVLFVVGIALFAVFTRGEIAVMEQSENQQLPFSALLISWTIILFLCLARVYTSAHGMAGSSELEYALNRQQMLAAGYHPYTQFEFLYGPLLLYPGAALSRLLHLSQANGYYASWVLEWLIGTPMLWMVVRSFDMDLRFRNSIYAGLFFYESLAVLSLGVNYTPFRTYSSAFLILAAYSVWKRTHNPWKTVVACVLAIGLAIAISMEQALGVAAGLTGYLLLLAASPRIKFPRTAMFLFVFGCLICVGITIKLHLLDCVLSFASGGLKFPLLPSVSTCAILFIYVVAGTLLYGYVRQSKLDTAAIPLAIAGLAMLPSAFGRCDVGHLLSATPAVVVGVAAISSMPSVRRWWLAFTVIALFGIPSLLNLRGTPAGHAMKSVFKRTPKTRNNPADVHPTTEAAGLHIGPPPCSTRFYVPFYMPWNVESYPQCLDTGYFLGQGNLSTPKDIRRKIQEMQDRPHEPLLLATRDLASQFVPADYETNMDHLYSLEGAYVLPRARNKPLSLEPVILYVRSHYVPGPIVNQGQMQIWYPVEAYP